MFNKLFENSTTTSSNDEDEDKKKKQTSLASSAISGDSESPTIGYKYSDDKVANIIGYCFGGEENQKKLTKIIDESSKIDDLPQRKQYIEEQVKDHAKEFDKGIASGMTSGLANAKAIYDKGIKDGSIKPPETIIIEDAGSKGDMFQRMSLMGLNVNSDNLTTTYSQGPNGNPRVYCMTWVNRPTPEMANEKSKQNELASLYDKTLSGQDKTDFNNDITQHKKNAQNGDPKIEIKSFRDLAMESHKKAYQQKDQALKQAGLAKAGEVAKQIASGSFVQPSNGGKMRAQSHPSQSSGRV
jgi:hypothetical protein